MSEIFFVLLCHLRDGVANYTKHDNHIPGANFIKKVQSILSTFLWNKALQVSVASHVTSFCQSDCIISN